MIRSANLTGSVSRNAGGLYESVRRLAQSLQVTGIEICVFGTEDEHTAADIGAWAPVPVKAFRPHWPAKFSYSRDFYNSLVEFAPDLTHTHGLWLYPSIATNHFSRRLGLPYVISSHGMLDPWALCHSRWKKVVAYFLYESAHLHQANCLRALCEAEARAIRKIGLTNPIAIIPNGVDLPETRSQESAVSSQNGGGGKQPWDGLVEPGRKVLLFLSRIHPKKGLVNLLKAWAVVNRKSKTENRKSDEWVLAIAGWDQGGHERELRILSSELGIEASVKFLGPKFGRDKAACYQHCDAFILPSLSEGLPMVILEAWAYGKPVLMTPECNLPEGFAMDAALRMEPSAKGIEHGLRELFQASSSALQVLGANGLQLARQRFAWTRVGVEMKELYEWLLGGGNKPACIADF
jgi:glycosyltransferase involved in cell wall biosynthesis